MILAEDAIEVGYNWWEIVKVALAALVASGVAIQLMTQRRHENND